MKRIGIVGGLGPEPTVDYYRTVIDSFRKRFETNNTPEIVIYSLNLQAFLLMMETGQKERPVDYITGAMISLYRAGADFALIAAGTPDIFLDEIRHSSPIPILSIVEETARVVSKRKWKRFGLFGTKFTMQADLYPRVFSQDGMSVFVPRTEEQDYIHGKLVGELQFGRVLGATRRGLLDIVKRMKEEDKIQGLILGCTELPLILKEGAFGIPFFNTTKIHAESAVDWCLLNRE
jgi:aspartate racemase